MKLQDPGHQVTVYERNRPDDTFGWGVVFSDQTLENLRAVDPELAASVEAGFAHWDDIDVFFNGRQFRSSGHGFVGIGRLHLLQILYARAKALGVDLRFETDIESIEPLRSADLVVAADGIHSKIRSAYADFFQPDIELRHNRFVWLGTKRVFDAFTFLFEKTAHGWVQVHAYRFDKDTSTFIVEMPEDCWRAHGCDGMSTEETIAFCEELFAPALDGHALLSNARHFRGREWIAFPRVSNARWHHENVVLLGDAAHTAHFSIGSGTKLGMEDAIELSAVLHQGLPLSEALQVYEERRRLEVLRLQSAARNSTEWFEHVARYENMAPEQFTYSLLTRSQRVSHENLRLRDAAWLETYEDWFAGRAAEAAGASRADLPKGKDGAPPPPMFTPFSLRGMTLKNRVVVSPMAMYSADEGVPGAFHEVHLGARALGGAGLVMTEMTAPTLDGRITPGCTAIASDDHTKAWQRIVDFVHGHTDAKIGIQLGHAGPKGSTKKLWDGMDVPLDTGNWPIIGPSAIPYTPASQVPREVTRADMDALTEAFVAATRRSAEAGFDLVELHAAHGYLLSSFLTPLRNQRADEYGGSLENRLRFPLEVFRAMRAVWPKERPMSVRISATDWHPEGNGGAEAVVIARAFRAAGADIIDVSAGQTTTEAKPVYGRMFQTPFSDQIRNEVGVPTMAVGNIYEVDHVNSIIAAGRADLCCLARPHLSDPNWTMRAAAKLGVHVEVPKPYQSGMTQMARQMERAAEMVIQI